LIYGTAELDYEDVVAKRIGIFERRLSHQDGETYARRLSGKWRCVIFVVPMMGAVTGSFCNSQASAI
jgi:hypothetical protein